MSRFRWAFGAFIALTLIAAWSGVAAAQTDRNPAKEDKKGSSLQGRVIHAGPDGVVVRTRDNKEITVHTNNRTRFMHGDRIIRLPDIRVGTDIRFIYTINGDQYLADTITVGDTVADDTILEGEVVRVAGTDQFILQTPDGKEVTVFVDPSTRFELDRVARLTDLRPGVVLGVTYEPLNQRFVARRIFGLNRMQGEVVRVVGTDQVILRTPEQKEFIVYVDPQTRYLLTDRGGAFADLRPGVRVGVFYNTHDRRNVAIRFFGPPVARRDRDR